MMIDRVFWSAVAFIALAYTALVIYMVVVR